MLPTWIVFKTMDFFYDVCLSLFCEGYFIGIIKLLLIFGVCEGSQVNILQTGEASIGGEIAVESNDEGQGQKEKFGSPSLGKG